MTDRETLLAAAGAIIAEGAVRRFRAPAEEREALAEGAGLIDADHRDRVAIVGPDAEAFLERLLTVGVEAMAPGQGGRTFLLDARGRIQLAFDLYRLEADRFLTDATPGHGAEIIERLDMFHFGEQVHFEPGDGAESALEIHGPKAAEVVAAMGLLVPEAPGAHVVSQPGAVAVRTIRRDRTGGPGFLLVFPPAGYDEVWQAARRAGARPAGLDALDAARIAAGTPSHPEELGPHSSPLEMGGLDGITEGKGCYPGQEVIERTIALGKPPRTLVRLRIDRHAAAGDDVIDGDGKAVGALTSVAPEGEGMVALALLKRRAAQKGGPWRVGPGTASRIDDPTEAA